MNTSAKMITVLTVIALLTGGILAYWDAFTAPRIEQHRLEALKAAISEVLPQYDRYDEVTLDGITFYVGHREGEEAPVGVAFEVSGNGFQGKITMMVGINPDFTRLTGLKILEQIETPGLGTKIVEDPGNKADPQWFSNQFKGLLIEPRITYVKNKKPTNPNEIQAITGATISSRSVVAILNKSIAIAREIYLKKARQQVGKNV